MWYSVLTDSSTTTLVPVPVERAKDIISLNRKDIFPENLIEAYSKVITKDAMEFKDVVGQESISRFENKKKGRNKNRNKGRNKPRPQQRKG